MPKAPSRKVKPLSTTLNDFIVKLDLKGVIIDVSLLETDSLSFHEGNNLLTYLTDDSQPPFLSYLKECLREGHSLGGELFFRDNPSNTPTILSMIKHEDTIIVVALNETQRTLEMLESMVKIYHKQANKIRELYAETSTSSDYQTYLEELSKLNSELINTQRELAQKNSELKRLNKELKDLSTKDFLTNIPNRRKFFEDIYAFVQEEPYTLIMIDFNDFKTVNDTKGHKYGDIVLKAFATHINELVERYQGKSYRLGGDEFALLIPSSANFSLDEHARKLDTFLNDYHPKLTIAYGVETIDHTNVNEDTPAENTMAKADKKMYDYKYKVKQ